MILNLLYVSNLLKQLFVFLLSGLQLLVILLVYLQRVNILLKLL